MCKIKRQELELVADVLRACLDETPVAKAVQKMQRGPKHAAPAIVYIVGSSYYSSSISSISILL